MRARIYLAWEVTGGGLRIRRRSPDFPDTVFGYQGQSWRSLRWLTENGHPAWPDCAAPGAQPFEVLDGRAA